MIEFSAHFRLDGHNRVHREVASFRKVEGRWFYVNGRLVAPPVREPVRADVAAGRNDPCPCGSGKKFKKCCAAA